MRKELPRKGGAEMWLAGGVAVNDGALLGSGGVRGGEGPHTSDLIKKSHPGGSRPAPSLSHPSQFHSLAHG